MNEKEIQFRDKQEVQGSGEPTKTGITFVPAVDIYETEEALTLVADMPGVSPEGIRIDLKDDQLTLGRRGFRIGRQPGKGLAEGI